MRDLPLSGIEPVSPALAGRFFTTEPPARPRSCTSLLHEIWWIAVLPWTNHLFLAKSQFPHLSEGEDNQLLTEPSPYARHRQTSFYGASLYCTLRYRVFHRLKVSGNPAWSKCVGAVFPAASAHWVSLCHVGKGNKRGRLPFRHRVPCITSLSLTQDLGGGVPPRVARCGYRGWEEPGVCGSHTPRPRPFPGCRQKEGLCIRWFRARLHPHVAALHSLKPLLDSVLPSSQSAW